jgi:hypothetical protein
MSRVRVLVEEIFVINVDGTGLVKLTNTPNPPLRKN